MADIEPPSFSLGLDLEPEPELPAQPQQHSAISPGPSSSTLLNDDYEDDDDFGLEVVDSDPETGPSSPRVFKRLRRGPAVEESRMEKREQEKVFCDNGDDEIEEFSSQEDFIRDAYPSAEYNSVCSSSKIPLHGCGVSLTTQSSKQLKEKKKERASDAPSSSCLGTGNNGLIFPNLTISPLRRFQLIDSDSEEPSTRNDVSRKISGTDLSSKERQPNSCEKKRNPSAEKHQSEDLWKDFCPKKSFHVPTPVLDEVCEEYFQSLRDTNSAKKLGTNLPKDGGVGCHLDANTIAGFEQSWNLADPLPPAYNYFCHDDSRIQSLVRSRLPNFSPLCIINNRENHQPSEPVINYMSQFNGEASKKGGTCRNNNKDSTRGRSKSKKSIVKEALPASQVWIDPKRSASIPKDAGKRRVHANGQAAGHWYTSPEGRKVYVSRSGQELTGQMAYRHYRKESGGYRKSKKKTNVKRKKKG
ncbi:uncharacterized protein LOC8282893 [Ricinus communis]|uniref:uncharacterized protein LOC8282893 n=1 Tax=Ricinus communis TaxID=3988 RepID=UPI0007723BCA|nr:uncharacterized protein LOC8282893 [Ricinus communis]|eukprot:XP_015577134.1 uncharacterized protein LOC8282893 [Ricinus communis]